MTIKRCTKCHLVKSTTEFHKNKGCKDELNSICKVCVQIQAKAHTERGLTILKKLAEERGCCKHCSLLYIEEDWHFFEFDHIDPKLKQSKKETESRWVIGHVDEFLTRVAPNLQLLCVKCHKLKTKEEIQTGGAVHQKKFGQQKPAQVIHRDLQLWDAALTLEPGEEYAFYDREGEWWTVRDMFGNLIRYEPRSNFIKH